MSNPSTNYGYPIPTPFSDNNEWGGLLNNDLAFFDTYLLSLATNFIGNSAPSGTPFPMGSTVSQIGQFWLNNTTNPYSLQMYTGTTWVELGTLNVSTNVWTPVGMSPSQNIRTITSSGTYTPSAGLIYALVEVIGGGGGGGGAVGGNSGTTGAGGGGGGAGGYCKAIFTAATIGASQYVTIGTGGSGGMGSVNGNSGGTTSFGSLLSSTGGTGGNRMVGTTGSSNVYIVTGGNGGIGNIGGSATSSGCGNPGMGFGTATCMSGGGGSNLYGGGGNAVGNSTSNGLTAVGTYGGGGSGAVSQSFEMPTRGGAGAQGSVIITEFII